MKVEGGKFFLLMMEVSPKKKVTKKAKGFVRFWKSNFSGETGDFVDIFCFHMFN